MKSFWSPLKKLPLVLALLLISATSRSMVHSNIMRSIVPGKTSAEELKQALGKPLQYVKERGREYFFYDVGSGPAQNATIALKSGIVEYINTICDEKLSEVNRRYAKSDRKETLIKSVTLGKVSKLNQVTFDDEGRGFLYEPHSKKIKVCLYYVPGNKAEELGK